ncbi:hypothetical protein [Ramlibacter tataouinensis]|uniref:hypothetical protein n=1 Tax=Ramlibacter tataouinensis TaxID=94132 RepID=UPI00117BE3D1|nr:hypothetical protein [Ramlibacter tataouinensis]
MNVGLASAGLNLSKTTGSSKPDVAGNPRADADLSGTGPLSKTTHWKINRKKQAALEGVSGIKFAAVPSTNPHSAPAMATEPGLRNGLAEHFGQSQATAALVDRIVDAVPQNTASERAPFKPQLLLGLALHTVCDRNFNDANAILDQIAAGQGSSQVFRMQRVLAETATGAATLGHMMGVQEPTRRDGLRDALKICSAMEVTGVLPAGDAGSVVDVVAAVSRESERRRLSHRIGSDDDVKPQLLSKALIYAHAKSEGRESEADVAPHKAAYVAWRKMNLTESGKGTDFNRAVGRMYKFKTYVDRADHGPRTMTNLLKELGMLFPQAVGKHRDPLTEARYGSLGAKMWTLLAEAQAFREVVTDSISPMRDHLDARLAKPEVLGNAGELNKQLANAAMLDVFAYLKRDDVAVPEQAVLAHAQKLHEALQGAAPFQPEMVLAHLRDFATPGKLQREVMEDEGGFFATKSATHLNKLRLRLSSLEELSEDLRAEFPLENPVDMTQLLEMRRRSQQLRGDNDADPVERQRVQHQLLHMTPVLLGEARAIAKGAEPGIPLFKFSDLIRGFTSAPRMGPTSEDAERVLKAVSGGKDESITNFASGGGGGINITPIVAMNALSALGYGGPAVLPTMRAEHGKKAKITVGDTLTGSRMFIGTESSTTIAGGLGGAIGYALPMGVAAVFAGFSAGKSWSPAEGLSLTVRIGTPGWEQKSMGLVDFMFRQARPAEGGTVPGDQSEIWERFSDRFGDDPHVGASWVNDDASSKFASASAGATARANTGSGTTIGASAYVALTYGTSKVDRKTQAVAGDVNTSVRGSALTATAGLGVPIATPQAPIKGDDVAGMLAVTPLAGVSVETQLSGGSAIARLARNDDGSFSAFPSQLIMGRKRPDELLSALRTPEIRASWLQRLVDLAPTPLAQEEAEAKLQRFEQAVAKVPRGGEQLFGIVTTMNPIVSDMRTDYEEVKNTLRGIGLPRSETRNLRPAASAEIQRLQGEDSHLLNDLGNWLDTAAYAFESGGRTNNTWIDFGMKLGKQAYASGDRLPALLVAARDEDFMPAVRT